MSQAEGQFKARLARHLTERGGYWLPIHGSAMMRSTLDIVGCYRGIFVIFELKSPKGTGKTRPRQPVVAWQVLRAGGVARLRVRTTEEADHVLDSIDAIMGMTFANVRLGDVLSQCLAFLNEGVTNDNRGENRETQRTVAH